MSSGLLSIPGRIGHTVQSILESGQSEARRPIIKAHNESNLKGVYVIGDLAGAPVIKLAMGQGASVIDHIASLGDGRGEQDDVLDVLIAGAGAAGLNAALQCQHHNLSYLLIEKSKVADTIENFPEGKWIYAEPDSTPPKGKLWLDGATKEDLLARWHQIISDNNLALRTESGLKSLERDGDHYTATLQDGEEISARRVVIATGQRGNPRKLNVPGEDQERVYHRLYAPKHYHDEDIIVVGGGNSAAEAALVLAEQNRVVISYRKSEFSRLFKDNRQKMDDAVEAGKLRVIFNSDIVEFGEKHITLTVNDPQSAAQEQKLPMDHAFVLVGAEVPVTFLKKLGLRLENDWDGSWLLAAGLTGGFFLAALLSTRQLLNLSPLFALLSLGCLVALIVMACRHNRYCYLGASFVIIYAVYAIAKGLWPYTQWASLVDNAYLQLSPNNNKPILLFGRSGPFWYTLVYTFAMTIFGLRAMHRWGFERRDRFQILRYCSLLAFQWIFFFIIPELLYGFFTQHQPLADVLGGHDQSWRSYGILYAWPLFFYTFFYNPPMIWVIWGIILSFVLIPLLTLWHGKRYCSWICGCGGLAETLGDRWRHLAPKGKTSVKWEVMNSIVLGFAIVATAAMLLQDTLKLIQQNDAGGKLVGFYAVLVDVWLVAILPVTLYPFMGGKVWCRYWCPLAKMMQLTSKWWRKAGRGKFAIHANDKCIACGECSRYCQVGIPVMQYGLKQEVLDNTNSSCIGCGICVTVCPMDVLSFSTTSAPMMPTVGGQQV